MMFRFLAFSDLHAHSFKYGAKQVKVDHWKGVYNSRLVDALHVLDEVRQYAMNHRIDHVVFGGDLFHRRQIVHTDALNLVGFKLRQFDPIMLHMLLGNHDMGDRHGFVHHLNPFAHMSDYIRVHDTVGITTLSDYYNVGIITVPYTDDLEEAKRRLTIAGELADTSQHKINILLAHLGMQGAKVGSDYVLVQDTDISSLDVPHDKFDLCLFGHYHQHQQLFSNGWYIGATHEHNWGDSGGKRGFLDITLDQGKIDIQRIETSAPKFVKLYEGSDLNGVKSNDFVRCYVSAATPEAKQQVEQLLPTSHIELIEESPEEDMPSLDLDKLSIMDNLQTWLDAKGRGDDADLLAVGRALVAKALEKSI